MRRLHGSRTDETTNGSNEESGSGEEHDTDGPSDGDTRSTTITEPVSRYFKEYTVTVTWDDGSDETFRVTDYSRDDNYISLYDEEPTLVNSIRASWSSNTYKQPRINLVRGEPLTISLSNARSVDVSHDEDLVAFAEDVEIVRHEEYDGASGEWEHDYDEATDDFDPDNYDVHVVLEHEYEELQDD